MPKKWESVKKRIEKWLKEEGLKHKEIQDPKTHFHLIVEHPAGSGRSIHIVHPKNLKNQVVVVTRIGINPNHRRALSKMQKKRRYDFLWELRFGLLFREGMFKIEPNVEKFEHIELVNVIYHEDLTRPSLLHAIRENFKCRLFVSWKLQKMAGEIPQTEQAPPF